MITIDNTLEARIEAMGYSETLWLDCKRIRVRRIAALQWVVFTHDAHTGRATSEPIVCHSAFETLGKVEWLSWARERV